MMQSHSTFHRNVLILLSGLSVLALMISVAQAAPTLPVQIAMADMGAIKNELAPSDPATQLTWAQLSNEQKTILAALGAEWDTLRPWQREKMLDIARAYPKLDTQQQLRMQRRLLRWSRMTPYERENARKRYQQFQSLSPEKKQELLEKWKAHQRKNVNAESEDPEFDISVP